MLKIKDNRIQFGIKITISTILIFVILRFIGIDNVLSSLSQVKPSMLAIGLIFTIPLIIFKSFRWMAIVRGFSAKLKFLDSVRFTLMAISFSLITPAKLGEFVKTKYLVDNANIRYLRSFITVFIDKGFDILAMAFLALIGISQLEIFSEINLAVISIFIIYTLILLGVFVFFDKVINFIPVMLPKKLKSRFVDINLTREIYLSSFIYSLGIWLILSIQGFIVLNSLGITTSLFTVISLIPLMALSSLVPFSLGGIGIRELIAISFLVTIGISADKAAIFSILYTLISSGIPAIIGGFLHLFYKNRKVQ
jgi:glycosyltransferase 2 family protein